MTDRLGLELPRGPWKRAAGLRRLRDSGLRIHDYVHYIFFSSQFGQARHFVREEVFVQFGHNVEANYKVRVALS